MKIMQSLRTIIQDPALHAAWLNTLSYLEYRGFRKIARSQKTADMNLDKLLHAMEEVRHAVFFKRQALKLGGQRFQNYGAEEMLGGFAAKDYFYHFDSNVAADLAGLSAADLRNAAYCLVTWLVEVRALAIYRIYEGLLREHQSELSVASILREEDRHLEEMVAASKQILAEHGFNANRLADHEESAFLTLWEAIESDLQKHRSGRNAEIQQGLVG